jgi:hypothetical protein
MKKFICAMALTLLGLGALSQQASATTVSSFSNTIAANTSFSDAYSFTFSGHQDGSFSAVANAKAVSNIAAAICSDALCTGGPLFSGTPGSVPGIIKYSTGSFLSLASATYYLVVSGLTSATPGSPTYFASLTLTPTVPVPPAIMLFVTALGGLGAFGFLRRKGTAAA